MSSTIQEGGLIDLKLRLLALTLGARDHSSYASNGEANQIIASAGRAGELIAGRSRKWTGLLPERVRLGGRCVCAEVEYQVGPGAQIEPQGETFRTKVQQVHRAASEFSR